MSRFFLSKKHILYDSVSAFRACLLLIFTAYFMFSISSIELLRLILGLLIDFLMFTSSSSDICLVT